MTTRWLILCSAVLCFGWGIAQAGDSPARVLKGTKIPWAPGEVKWAPMPGLAGAMQSPLWGDPARQATIQIDAGVIVVEQKLATIEVIPILDRDERLAHVGEASENLLFDDAEFARRAIAWVERRVGSLHEFGKLFNIPRARRHIGSTHAEIQHFPSRCLFHFRYLFRDS